MLTTDDFITAQETAATMLAQAGITLTPEERQHIEIADFGLSRLPTEGLQLITYINTDRVCAKDLVLTPSQTCPEHLHPPIGDDPGKEETFRCRSGIVYVYLEGQGKSDTIQATVPADSREFYTVFQEFILHPGEQVTIYPNTLHWFQAGPEGAVVSEFSTRSRDEYDIFTDPRIQRATSVEEQLNRKNI